MFQHKLIPGREEEAVNRAVARLVAAVGAFSRVEPNWRAKLHTLLPPYSEPWEAAIEGTTPTLLGFPVKFVGDDADDDADAA
jgi:hypothetical protein